MKLYGRLHYDISLLVRKYNNNLEIALTLVAHIPVSFNILYSMWHACSVRTFTCFLLISGVLWHQKIQILSSTWSTGVQFL